MRLHAESPEMARKRGRPVEDPKKNRMVRHKSWSFSLKDADGRRPLLVHPIRYLGYKVTEDDTLSGVVVFNHQLAMPHRHLPTGTSMFPLPKLSVYDSIETLRNDYKDLEEFGVPPMTNKQKSAARYKPLDDALQAAREGRFTDIPNDMWLKYGAQFNAIKNCMHSNDAK